ncbi:hypothetical protein [Caecibacteroides pullorum]|uniref:Uncharacterized protein n=1 Tax=Caecibacteroides pullorum TaxID=2725562 RepID=A0AA40ZRB1_9BACT|nr:hypothetical protein [Caecibacteroides pullorum]MBM6856513.1 hypothetical protein [Caecibacteroides pullorum]MBV8057519.1 hypothetical protein [Caecibacteroides pullorum]
MEKNKRRKDSQELPDINNELSDHTKYAWLKNILRKIFTIQTIGLIVAIIATIISYVQYRNEKMQVEALKLEKLNDDKIKYHDDLVLRLGGYELKNNETYDIDVIYSNKDAGYALTLQLYNGGKLNANNILIRFDGKRKSYIMKGYRSKNEFDFEKSGGGEFMVEYLYPQEVATYGIIYFPNNVSQGDEDNCRFVCSCDDKANPYVVYLNMRLFQFDSIEEYISYINLKSGSKEIAERYWLDENKFLLHCVSKLGEDKTVQLDGTVYKIIKNNGILQLQSISDKNLK